MRIGAFCIVLFGGLFGLFNAYEQASGFGQGLHYGSTWLTVGCSILGIIGGCLLLLRWRFAPWVLLIAAVGGVYPNLILWEGAGSFFLVGAFIGFTALRA